MPSETSPVNSTTNNMQHLQPATPQPAPSPTQQQATPPQQFCLRWNNYQSNLTNVFDQLLQSESFVDVTLACDGQSVKAHKMVLSACSPYFQALFVENPCQHPIIIMRDIKWPELRAAVEFMYRGEINVSQEQIGPLLRVAETLKIRGLADVNGEQDCSLDAAERPSSPRHNSSRKRRRTSAGAASPPSAASVACTTPPSSLGNAVGSIVGSTTSAAGIMPPGSAVPLPVQLQLSLPPPPPPPPTPHPDDMEIKPGIAEMIREEERAKLLENSHAWLGASTSSIADSYQYQLQSMWQKCWNTNQSLVHNLRFRERGPLKSWRPETMAEAIFSVLKEGLSLSQAARKYDIPYPTFVLYANRVHNMLGPSADGGADLRPKGRGRPQRILLGVWPDEHIRGVIRAVVFRDSMHIKEESQHLGYARLAVSPGDMMGSPASARHHPPSIYDGLSNYANGPLPESTVSPGAAAAAAVAAISQGLRQQMCSMVAAAQQHPEAHHHPNIMRPSMRGVCSPVSPSAQDLRMTPPEESPLMSPLAHDLHAISAMSGLAYKPGSGYPSPHHPEHLFPDDLADLMPAPPPSSSNRLALDLKERSPPVKLEPMAGCRD